MRSAELRRALKDAGYVLVSRGKHEIWERAGDRITMSHSARVSHHAARSTLSRARKGGCSKNGRRRP